MNFNQTYNFYAILLSLSKLYFKYSSPVYSILFENAIIDSNITGNTHSPSPNKTPLPKAFDIVNFDIIIINAKLIQPIIGNNSNNIVHGVIPDIFNHTASLYIGINAAHPCFPAFQYIFHLTIMLYIPKIAAIVITV